MFTTEAMITDTPQESAPAMPDMGNIVVYRGNTVSRIVQILALSKSP